MKKLILLIGIVLASFTAKAQDYDSTFYQNIIDSCGNEIASEYVHICYQWSNPYRELDITFYQSWNAFLSSLDAIFGEDRINTILRLGETQTWLAQFILTCTNENARINVAQTLCGYIDYSQCGTNYVQLAEDKADVIAFDEDNEYLKHSGKLVYFNQDSNIGVVYRSNGQSMTCKIYAIKPID